MTFDEEDKARKAFYKIMGDSTSEALKGVIIGRISEEIENDEVYWVANIFKSSASIGSMSIKRREVIEYIRENKLSELGI